MRPIVIAHHLIWTAYGWWLPNDPRGGMSRSIAFDTILELGELHYGRKQIQPSCSDIRAFYERAKDALTHDLLEFTYDEIELVSQSIQQVIEEQTYTCYACAIMPDHLHILIRRHKHQAEEMIQNFQHQTRLRLRTEKKRSKEHPVWGGPGWKVFLDHPDEVRRTIRYIEDNPIKARRPRQKWGFVKAYDNWPFHEGHSPNSPYARRMRNG